MKRGPSDGELERAVEEQWRDYGARGLTTVTDLAYGRKERFDKLLETISLKDSCPIRLALYRFVHGAVQDEVRIYLLIVPFNSVCAGEIHTSY